MALLPFGSAPSKPQGFTYNHVISTKTLTIPLNFDNVCFAALTIDGIMILTGDAVIL